MENQRVYTQKPWKTMENHEIYIYRDIYAHIFVAHFPETRGFPHLFDPLFFPYLVHKRSRAPVSPEQGGCIQPRYAIYDGCRVCREEIYVYIYICICLYVYIYIYVCIYICICICINVYMHICTYVYMYTYVNM